MKDQHTKISGYRDLTQDEIDLMNKIKALEAEVLALHESVWQRLVDQAGGEASEQNRMSDARAFEWHRIARENLESGFMFFVRSVAQPQPKR